MKFSALFAKCHRQSLQTNLRITLDDTLLNGWLIGRCSRIYEKIFDFQDRLSLRKFFA